MALWAIKSGVATQSPTYFQLATPNIRDYVTMSQLPLVGTGMTCQHNCYIYIYIYIYIIMFCITMFKNDKPCALCYYNAIKNRISVYTYNYGAVSM